VLDQGKLDVLRPSAPFAEGEAIELKLVEVGLHDAAAGVGKVGVYDVVVAGAAKLVGKKVSAKIGRILDGVAYATLADEAAPAARITFEAEAEKPTRAPSTRKAAAEPAEPEPRLELEPAPELELLPEAELQLQPEAEEESEVDAEAAEETAPSRAAPAKKRTHRGTRGGRSRKKKPVTAETPAESTDESDGSRPAPTIHVPPPDLGAAEPADEAKAEAGEAQAGEAETAADGAPKRKRTRRGTRGGRKRRKPAASENGQQGDATDEQQTDVAEAPQAAAEEQRVDVAEVAAAVTEEDGEAPDYVPMSEWIEDFGPGRAARGQTPKP
jgi:hypothetical protein